MIADKGCLIGIVIGLLLIIVTSLLAVLLVRMYGAGHAFQELLSFARSWALWPAVFIGASFCVGTLYFHSDGGMSTDLFPKIAIGVGIILVVGILGGVVGIWSMTIKAWRVGDVAAWRDGRLVAYKALNSGEFADACRMFEPLVQKNPTNVQCLVGFGYAKLGTKNYSQAKSVFDRALAVDPNDPDSRHGLASALDGLGQADMAISVLQELLKTAKYWDKEGIEKHIADIRQKANKPSATSQ